MDNLSESLLDRLTHPLRVDRQLQQEVRRELSTHLHDAIAENRAAGMNDEEAQQQAIRALGDEKLLSEQLWRANRRRIRVRTWVRWGIGLVALPAAAVVALLALSSVLVSYSLLSAFGVYVAGDIRLQGAPDLAEKRTSQLVQRMSADDRLLFESQPSSWGGSSAQQWAVHAQAAARPWAAHAQAAAERWPDDPALRANRVLAELNVRKSVRALRVDELESFLQLCDAAQRAEPDNGLYPLMKAGALLADSAEAIEPVVDDPDEIRVILDHRQNDSRGRQQELEFNRYRIHDAVRFREGLALLHEAAGKPRISDYSMALAKRRISLLGQPRDFNDVLRGTALSISVMLPDLSLIRSAADKATSAAIYPELAAMVADNKLDAQRNSVQDVYRIGEMVVRDAKESGVAIQFMISKGMIDMAVAHAIYSQEQAHPGTRAAELRQYDGASDAMYRAARDVHFSQDTIRTLGVFDGCITPSVLVPDATGIRAGRQAEYAVCDSLFVSLTMMLLLAVGALAMVPALWQRVAGGNGYVPLLPWRATSRIIVPTMVVVIAIIGALNFLPGTNRQYGLRFNGIATLSQYLLLLCIVLLLQKVILLRELGLKGLVADVSRKHRYYALACIGGLAGLLVLGAMRDRAPWPGGSEPSLIDILTLLAAFSAGLVLVLSIVWPRIVRRPSGGRSTRIAGVLVSILAVCGIVAACYTNVVWDGRSLPMVATVLACMLGGAVCLVVWLADHLSLGLSKRHSAAATAAFGPIGILTALCLGLICLPALKWQERSSVAAMLSGRTYLMENEFERSTLKDVGDWILSHPAPLSDGSIEQRTEAQALHGG